MREQFCESMGSVTKNFEALALKKRKVLLSKVFCSLTKSSAVQRAADSKVKIVTCGQASELHTEDT